MANISTVGPAFVAMAHEIVWCNAATVDVEGRPRSRILHPIWVWDGSQLQGWIATEPTPIKREHLQAHPYISLNYWQPNQDTCVAECRANWAFDDKTRVAIWNLFKETPSPVGYDPSMIPAWDEPTSDNFAVIKLDPWRLRVFPGDVLMGGQGTVLTWEEE